MRSHRWLLGHRIFGNHLRRYRDGEGLPLSSKVATIVLLWGILAASAFLAVPARLWWVRLFLLAVGVPILVMEFSVGRAAQRNLGAALQKLEPKGSRWHTFGPLSLIGSYLLMMFYTTVAGWMLAYCWSMLKGDLSGQRLSIAFVDYLRPEMKFDGLPALMTQMAADCDRARALLSAP